MLFLIVIPILIVVCIISVTSGHPHERRQIDEPICSKFDYEEKLLEKMIRKEMKMEKIIQEVKCFNRTMIEETNRLSDLADKSLIPIVGFNAHLSLTKTVNRWDRVVFDTVITNQGDSYGSSTGIFTAPYTGLYFFSAHVCNQGQKEVQYAIYQGSKQLTSSTQRDLKTDYSCSSVSAIAWAYKAVQVWVKASSTSVFYNDIYRWSAFTGSLFNK